MSLVPHRKNKTNSQMPAQDVETLQRRSSKILKCIAFLFICLLIRAGYIQWIDQDFLKNQGQKRFQRTINLEPLRGLITDRHGEPLAVSSPVFAIWASPMDMPKLEHHRLIKLAKMLDIAPSDLQEKLSDKKKEFVYLKRQISPHVTSKIMSLKIPGVSSIKEYRRYYPTGESSSHLIGITGVDGAGQEGIELARNALLSGRSGVREILRDLRGNIVEDVVAMKPPQDGQTVTLSIDHRIQYLAFRELKKVVEEHRAKAGSVVVLDAQTGELLAMANMPSFNPNLRKGIRPQLKRNRAVIDLFEPGSVTKPFVVARALDLGLVRPNTLIKTSAFSLSGKLIHDVHHYPQLSVEGIIQKSSNVGMVKLSQMMGRENTWSMYDAIGFGKSSLTGFPGEASGRLRPASTWRPIEQATISYGYGFSTSLLQLARAYTVFTTDGRLLPVSLIKQDHPLPSRQVIKPETALAVRHMMMKGTEQGGTGKRAQILGYHVAGKTGTAHKSEGKKGYAAHRYVGSFVGFAPATRPRLIVAVMIDEPSIENRSYFGGVIAAPLFSKIMGGALRTLSISPDAVDQQRIQYSQPFDTITNDFDEE
jgi:cell division protein FtsI (penicillin-binding protein 3)